MKRRERMKKREKIKKRERMKKNAKFYLYNSTAKSKLNISSYCLTFIPEKIDG